MVISYGNRICIYDRILREEFYAGALENHLSLYNDNTFTPEADEEEYGKGELLV